MQGREKSVDSLRHTGLPVAAESTPAKRAISRQAYRCAIADAVSSAALTLAGLQQGADIGTAGVAVVERQRPGEPRRR